MVRLTLLLFPVLLVGQSIDYAKQVKNKPALDVREYGAKCNGVADDTTSVQAALNAANAAGGGRVMLPPGSNCKWSTVTISNGGGVWLDGGGTGQIYGTGVRVLLTTTAGNHGVNFTGSGFVTTHNRISNIQFDASGASSSMGYAVNINAQQAFYLDHVSIYNAANGIHFSECYFCYADNFDMLGLKPLTGIGLKVSNWGILWASKFLINGAADPYCGYTCEPLAGVQVLRSAGVFLSTGDIEHAGTCMSFAPGSGEVVEFSRITAVFCDQNSAAGIVLAPTHASGVVHGIEFNNSWSSTSGGAGYRFGTGTGTVNGIAINGGQIVNNMGNGVDINAATNITVSGVRMTKNNRQSTGIVNTSSTGNLVTLVSGGNFGNTMTGRSIVINGLTYTTVISTSNTLTLSTNPGNQTNVAFTLGNAVGCGVHIAANQGHIQIRNNVIGTIDYLQANIANEILNSQTYGICVDPGGSGDYIELVGNTVVDNVTAGISYSSSGTHNVVRDNVGYNPVGISSVTVTTSPFTYTSGATPETVYITGGTVSGVTRSGTTVCSSSPCILALAPNTSAIVTYSSLPTMSKDVH